MLFVLFSFPTCLFLSMSVPTGEPPDEPAHIVRADSLLNGDFIGYRRQCNDVDGDAVIGAGVTANPALLETSLDYSPVVASVVEIALGLAHEVRIAPHAAILLGRLTNSFCFVIVGAVALAIARYGRGLLFLVLTLPTTLSLAASFNQDGLMIPAATLCAALLTRCPGPSAGIMARRRAGIIGSPPGRDYWLAAGQGLWLAAGQGLWLAAIDGVQGRYFLPVLAFVALRSQGLRPDATGHGGPGAERSHLAGGHRRHGRTGPAAGRHCDELPTVTADAFSMSDRTLRG